MKKSAITISLLLLIAAFQMAARAQATAAGVGTGILLGKKSEQDLTLRQAAYFQFHDDGSIDLKSSYVTPGKTFKINKSAAIMTENGAYKFALGLFVQRDNQSSAIPGAFVAVASGEQKTLLYFQFKKDQTSLQARNETPFLKMGVNKIKVTVDHDNKIAESNESNNSFEFNIEVVEDKNDAPILKLPKKKN